MFRSMNKVVAAVLLTAGACGAASADVIDFESISGPYVPSSYKSLTWGGGSGPYSWVVSSESSNIFSGTEAHSGNRFAWSNGATNLSLSGAAFDMTSLWARIGNLSSGTATAHGFRGGVEVYSQVLNLTSSYQLFSLNFSNIDQWTLTNQANNVLIDDITLNGASVPEPGSLALMGVALLGVAAARRKSGKTSV